MEKLIKSEVESKIKEGNYEFAWINTFSDLKLIKLDKDKQQENCIKDLDDLIEAKFFDMDREMSIIKCDEQDKFSVVEFNDEDKEYIEEKQILEYNKSPLLNGKDKKRNDELIIRNYLDYDEEGQAYICYTKLCYVEKGR